MIFFKNFGETQRNGFLNLYSNHKREKKKKREREREEEKREKRRIKKDELTAKGVKKQVKTNPMTVSIYLIHIVVSYKLHI